MSAGVLFSILEIDSFSTSLSARAFHSYLSLDSGMIYNFLLFCFSPPALSDAWSFIFLSFRPNGITEIYIYKVRKQSFLGPRLAYFLQPLGALSGKDQYQGTFVSFLLLGKEDGTRYHKSSKLEASRVTELTTPSEHCFPQQATQKRKGTEPDES